MGVQADHIFYYLFLSALLKYGLLFAWQNKRPKEAKLVGKVTRLQLYPLKSMRPLVGLDEAVCTTVGLQVKGDTVTDRNIIIADGENRFLNQKNDPKMALIEVKISGDMLILDAPEQPTLKIPKTIEYKREDVMTIVAKGVEIEVVQGSQEAGDWFNKYMSRKDVRVLYNLPGLRKRHVNKGATKWHRAAKESDIVSFQDHSPFMLASEASLADLTSKRHNEVQMERFRPNIIVSGGKAFDEDNWKEVYIGEETKFRQLKLCNRCPMVTIDQNVGKFDDEEQPLQTLREYRLVEPAFGKSPCFGINLLLDRAGVIKVGDPVYAIIKKYEVGKA